MASGPLGNVIRFLRRTVGSPAGAEQSDRQLLVRFAQARDQAAFTTLVERHGPMVWAACQRVLGDGPDAEDAFQAAFVVLAQKAGSSGWQESISSWLYEVAYRVAMRARRDAARRRQREREVTAMQPVNAQPDADSGELRAVLDDELTRLPEKFRAPLVLCYLQGKTNDEAARQLGWPKGTVASRLARARDLLRGRLTRRGLTLSAAALATALADSAAPAAMPTGLVQSTIKTAALLPSAKALTTGAIPAPVASLAQGVLRTMFLNKVKVAGLIALVLAVFGLGTGMITYRMLTASPNEAQAAPLGERPPEGPERPRASKPAVKDGLSVTIQPAKAVFGKDEMPVIDFHWTNLTQEPFKLAAMNYFPERIKEADLLDLKTGASWKGTYLPPARTAAPAPVPAEVAPAQTVQSHVGLGQEPWTRWSWRVQDKPPVIRALPPGKYRVAFTIAFGRGLAEKQGYWIGEITTNPTEFEITDKSAVPVVKDGLAVTLVTHKDYYAKGETPAVTITFKNTTDKPMTFHHPAHAVRIWSYAFTEIKTRTTWEGPYPQGINTLPPVKLPAGESTLLNVDFRDVEYRTTDAEQPRTGKELPPGRYRLSVTVKFDNLPAAQFPNVWTGEIKAPPVEFEIMAR